MSDQLNSIYKGRVISKGRDIYLQTKLNGKEKEVYMGTEDTEEMAKFMADMQEMPVGRKIV